MKEFFIRLCALWAGAVLWVYTLPARLVGLLAVVLLAAWPAQAQWGIQQPFFGGYGYDAAAGGSPALNPTNWYKADGFVQGETVSVQATNGETVTLWNNEITSANWGDMQSSAEGGNGKPIFSSSLLNGKPGLVFGSLTWLAFAGVNGTWTTNTICFVAKATNTTDLAVVINGDGASDKFQIGMDWPNACGSGAGAGTQVYFVDAGTCRVAPLPDSSSWMLVTVIINGASSSVRTNGVETATFNAGSANLVKMAYFGGHTGASNRGWRGYIAEFIHYARVLDASELTQTEGYLRTKYGL